MNNLDTWNRLKTPPKWAIKEIQSGRLKGKSDINPQWRYQAMCEEFGPCGIGWKYEITKLWNEPGTAGQIMAFATVNVYVKRTKDNGEEIWSDPIPGVGGSMLVAQETRGLHVSDEGYKMAVTDALSVALKYLGVAAEIYSGIFESKYEKNTEPPQQAAKQPPKQAPTQNSQPKFPNTEIGNDLPF